MSDLSDLISAGDAYDAGQAALPFDTGGFNLTSLFADSGSFADVTGPLVAPVLNLPSTSGGMTDLLTNITRLVQVGYQGEAMVNQQKYLNKIAQAKLANQLDTVRTTPNIWWVLGAGAAGLFLLELTGRGKR